MCIRGDNCITDDDEFPTCDNESISSTESCENDGRNDDRDSIESGTLIDKLDETISNKEWITYIRLRSRLSMLHPMCFK